MSGQAHENSLPRAAEATTTPFLLSFSLNPPAKHCPSTTLTFTDLLQKGSSMLANSESESLPLFQRQMNELAFSESPWSMTKKNRWSSLFSFLDKVLNVFLTLSFVAARWISATPSKSRSRGWETKLPVVQCIQRRGCLRQT